MHILYEVAKRYPQLLLPVEEGISQSEEFKDAVLRGKPVDREPDFSFAAGDCLTSCDTPAGRAEILFLENRDDFVHAYRALGYRCEPADIPPSVGAATILGLFNWEKIHAHEAEWLAAGNTDWPAEFARFTSDKANFVDTLILLSAGPYSSVSAQQAGLGNAEWIEKSIQIRKYHELTHFVCRQKVPEKKDALRDEIYADCIGLLSAFGTYDTRLAEVFLGIETGTFREGGRLSHYMGDDTQESVGTAHRWVLEAAGRVAEAGWDRRAAEDRTAGIFDLLLRIY